MECKWLVTRIEEIGQAFFVRVEASEGITRGVIGAESCCVRACETYE